MRKWIKQLSALAIGYFASVSQAQADEDEVVSQSLENPLSFNSDDGGNGLLDFLSALLDVVLVIAVPFLVFFVILAGFYYVTAQGNPEKIEAANKALLYAAIGAVIVLGAGAIAALVENTVNSFNTT